MRSQCDTAFGHFGDLFTPLSLARHGPFPATSQSPFTSPIFAPHPQWGGMVLATSKKTKDKELPLGDFWGDSKLVSNWYLVKLWHEGMEVRVETRYFGRNQPRQIGVSCGIVAARVSFGHGKIGPNFGKSGRPSSLLFFSTPTPRLKRWDRPRPISRAPRTLDFSMNPHLYFSGST